MPPEAPPSRLPRRLLTACAALLVTLLTAAACALTWDVLRTLAEAGRVDRTWSAVYPSAADALLVLTLLSLLAARHARWWSRALRWTLLLLLLAGLSWVAVQHAVWGFSPLPAKPLRAAVAAAPHVMLVVGVWLWLTTLRLLRTPAKPRRAASTANGPDAPSAASTPSAAAPGDLPNESPLELLFHQLPPPHEPHEPRPEPSAQNPARHPDRAPLSTPVQVSEERSAKPLEEPPSKRPAPAAVAPYPMSALSSEPELHLEPAPSTEDALPASAPNTQHAPPPNSLDAADVDSVAPLETSDVHSPDSAENGASPARKADEAEDLDAKDGEQPPSADTAIPLGAPLPDEVHAAPAASDEDVPPAITRPDGIDPTDTDSDKAPPWGSNPPSSTLRSSPTPPAE